MSKVLRSCLLVILCSLIWSCSDSDDGGGGDGEVDQEQQKAVNKSHNVLDWNLDEGFIVTKDGSGHLRNFRILDKQIYASGDLLLFVTEDNKANYHALWTVKDNVLKF